MKWYIWIFYVSSVIAFISVMTAMLALMYLSPDGFVRIYEHNLLIRNSEILIGIVTVIMTLNITFKVVMSGQNDLTLVARKDKPDLGELMYLKAQILNGLSISEG